MPIDDPMSEKIIQCAFSVCNGLGHGFLEKVYEKAMVYEMRKGGIPFQQQAGIKVFYDGQEIGQFYADFLVDNRIVVELKAAKAIENGHIAQCLNYLRASGSVTCLLLNFGQPRLEIRRLGMGRG